MTAATGELIALRFPLEDATPTVALRGILGFFEHAAAVNVGLALMILGLGPGRHDHHAASRRGGRHHRVRDCSRRFLRADR
jgi:hypothetical protein